MIRCGRRWWIRSQKEPKTCSSVVPHRVTRSCCERWNAKSILQSPVGHVSHGGHADALEQSESSFQMLSRERRLPTKSERQAGPGLRGGVECKVQIDKCKLQNVRGSASYVIPPVSNCQFAMSTLQFAIARRPCLTWRPRRCFGAIASRRLKCFRESGVCRRRTIAKRGLANVVGWIAKCKLTNANCKMFVARQA
jgi:hypothetical protein